MLSFLYFVCCVDLLMVGVGYQDTVLLLMLVLAGQAHNFWIGEGDFWIGVEGGVASVAGVGFFFLGGIVDG